VLQVEFEKVIELVSRGFMKTFSFSVKVPVSTYPTVGL
jgi:hypothetical protein